MHYPHLLALPHAHLVRLLLYIILSSFIETENCSSVTENGFAVKNENKMTIEEAVRDTDRLEYFKGNLAAIDAAINEDGVDIRSYFAWGTFIPSVSQRAWNSLTSH
jgi:beta-glucosidase/6-phospho-beta-glucosidase/beta-galactosidase